MLLKLRPRGVYVYGTDCLSVAVTTTVFVVVLFSLEQGRGTSPTTAQVPHRIAVVERLANLAGQQGPVTVSKPVVKDGVQQRVNGRIGGAQPLCNRKRGDSIALDSRRERPELDQRESHVQW